MPKKLLFSGLAVNQLYFNKKTINFLKFIVLHSNFGSESKNGSDAWFWLSVFHMVAVKLLGEAQVI